LRGAIVSEAAQRSVSDVSRHRFTFRDPNECKRLDKALRAFEATYQLSLSVFLVYTKQSIAEVTVAVEAALESDDRFYVCPLTYVDYLPEHAPLWIATQQHSAHERCASSPFGSHQGIESRIHSSGDEHMSTQLPSCVAGCFTFPLSIT